MQPTDSNGPTFLPPLEIVGDNGSPEEVFPLKRCQGDCDRNSDCEVRMIHSRVSYGRLYDTIHTVLSPSILTNTILIFILNLNPFE